MAKTPSTSCAGAALDVYETEPLPPDSPLRDPTLEDRVRLFSHFASAARVTRLSTDPNKGMAGRCVQAVIDALEGDYGGNPAKMPYVVNEEAFQEDEDLGFRILDFGLRTRFSPALTRRD